MITSIEIQNLRGIHHGELNDLSPLTILVGPNGCGKSTILEAFVLVVGLPDRRNTRTFVAERRAKVTGAGRLVKWRGDERADLFVAAGLSNRTTKRLHADVTRDDGQCRGRFEVGADFDFTGVTTTRLSLLAPLPPEAEVLTPLRLIDSRPPHSDASQSNGPVPLHQLYTATVKRGHRGRVFDLVKATVTDAVALEILAPEDHPELHVDFPDWALPVALLGDGTHELIRLVLELASVKDGLVLIEEPESHQHPANMRLAARAILAAVDLGVQVVLTTHSLEFIDFLLAECGDNEKHLDQLSLFRLKLDNGELLSARVPGAEVARVRHEIEGDLR
ncbi:MAG: AAA family ATPase [Phycisphaerae bacterium]